MPGPVLGSTHSLFCKLQQAWTSTCMSSFGLIPGGVTVNFFPILTKTAISKVTKQEVVGQSPFPFNINTFNPTMTSLIIPCFYCCCSVWSPEAMSQHRHQIYIVSYEFLQACNLLLILMRSGAREDSSGFVKESEGLERIVGEKRREKWHEILELLCLRQLQLT